MDPLDPQQQEPKETNIPMYATMKYDPSKPKSWTNYDLNSSDEEEDEEEEPMTYQYGKQATQYEEEYEDNSAW